MLALRAFAAATTLFAYSPDPQYMSWEQHPMVHRVVCDEGMGSAFRVGETHFLSVAHVTAMHHCAINGKPITVTEKDGKRDFSQFDARLPASNKLKVNCAGMKPGSWVFAVGYAHGAPFQTVIALYVTYAKSPNGQRVLMGPYDLIPGMSGGPIFDASGAVVGLNNAYLPHTPFSLSRELKATSICGGDIA